MSAFALQGRRGILLALGCFAAILCVLLWPSWRHNPDVSHGLFMPLVFLFLVHHSRAAGPWRYLRGGRGSLAAILTLAMAGLGLLFVGGLYAAAIDWSNALVDFLMATALSCLLGAALVNFANEQVRWIPFNWTSCMAVALWPVAAPIPPGTYTRLTLGLQLGVSRCVVHALDLLGIVAFRQGNVIQLSTTAVGVEEACSGVRSLVSCIFVGVFFSASLVSRPRARIWIIALSAPLALGMNFIRSMILTLLANSGVDIAGAWHDATGFAVLGVTAALLAVLALVAEHGGRGSPAAEDRDRRGAGVPPAVGDTADGKACGTPVSYGVLSAAIGLAALLVCFFYLNTHPATHRGAPVPDLAEILPESQPGWTVSTTTDLYRFSDVLQTDTLAQRIYRKDGPPGSPSVILYVAYWRPGQASVSLVATHTPDACWPGAGWVLQPLPYSQESLPVAGRILPEAESRLFTSPRRPQYVWFWHLYDGRPIQYINPYSLGRLLHIAWLYGFRHDGDQLFVRVSSDRPWPEFANEPFLKQFFDRLQPLGL